MTTATEPDQIFVKVAYKDERVYSFRGQLLITYAEKSQSTRGRQLEVWQTEDDRIVTREISLAPETHEPTPGNLYEIRFYDDAAAFLDVQRSKEFGKRLLRAMSEATGEPMWGNATYQIISDDGVIHDGWKHVIERVGAPDIVLVGEQVCGTATRPGIGPRYSDRSEKQKRGAKYHYWRIYHTHNEASWVVVHGLLEEQFDDPSIVRIEDEWVEVLHVDGARTTTIVDDLKDVLVRRFHSGYWSDDTALSAVEVDLIKKLLPWNPEVASLAYLPLPPVEQPAAEPEPEPEPYAPYTPPPPSPIDLVSLDDLVNDLVAARNGVSAKKLGLDSLEALEATMILALVKAIISHGYIHRGEY